MFRPSLASISKFLISPDGQSSLVHAAKMARSVLPCSPWIAHFLLVLGSRDGIRTSSPSLFFFRRCRSKRKVSSHQSTQETRDFCSSFPGVVTTTCHNEYNAELETRDCSFGSWPVSFLDVSERDTGSERSLSLPVALRKEPAWLTIKGP